jgi:hypothetical protein
MAREVASCIRIGRLLAISSEPFALKNNTRL